MDLDTRAFRLCIQGANSEILYASTVRAKNDQRCPVSQILVAAVHFLKTSQKVDKENIYVITY